MSDRSELTGSLLPIPAAVLGVSVDRTRTVHSLGQAPVTGSTPFRIASLTKTVTAAAVLLELRDHDLSVGVPALELLPQLADEWRADPGITLEHLLAQVSGLAETVDAARAGAAGSGHDALAHVAADVVRAGSIRAPGARWSYYNGNYFLAGHVLECLRGTSFEAALAGRILRPWGLEASTFTEPPGPVVHSPDETPPARGYPRARRPSGGLWSSAADLLTFGERLLEDAGLLAEIGGRRTDPTDPMPYGLGWALGPNGQWYVNGRLPGWRAIMLLVPDHRLVCVCLAASGDALPAIARLVSDVQRHFTGEDITSALIQFAA